MAISTDDKKVLALIKKVMAEKDKIGKLAKPQWKTSGSLPLPSMGPDRITIAVETCRVTLAMCRGSLLRMALDISETSQCVEGVSIGYNWCGYDIYDWISDIEQRLSIMDIKERQAKLAAMEDKLNKLTSPEQRRRMELEAIERELG